MALLLILVCSESFDTSPREKISAKLEFTEKKLWESHQSFMGLFVPYGKDETHL